MSISTKSAKTPKGDNTTVYSSTEDNGKKAMCNQCSSTTFSHKDLPFYKCLPLEDLDLYYCGCQGWD